MSSGAPLPQFYCGLSFVQLLLRSYRGLRFSVLLSPRCFPPDSIRANLDTLFTSCSQSHPHLSSLSQIWSIMILMIDSQRPVGSFGWTPVHCLQFMLSPCRWCVATRLLGGEILLSFHSWFRVRLACPWYRYLWAVDPLLAQIWNRLGEVDLHRQKIGKLFLLPFSRCLLAQCFLVMSCYSFNYCWKWPEALGDLLLNLRRLESEPQPPNLWVEHLRVYLWSAQCHTGPRQG